MHDYFKIVRGMNSFEYLLSVNISALKIHMSDNAHEAVNAFPEFITELRGEIPIKVKRYFSI